MVSELQTVTPQPATRLEMLKNLQKLLAIRYEWEPSQRSQKTHQLIDALNTFNQTFPKTPLSFNEAKIKKNLIGPFANLKDHSWIGGILGVAVLALLVWGFGLFKFAVSLIASVSFLLSVPFILTFIIASAGSFLWGHGFWHLATSSRDDLSLSERAKLESVSEVIQKMIEDEVPPGCVKRPIPIYSGQKGISSLTPSPAEEPTSVGGLRLGGQTP